MRVSGINISVTNASAIKAFFRKPAVHVLLIILTGLLVYSNSYHAPFIFDDLPNIVENPIIKNFHYFFDPSSAQGFDHYYGFKNRYVGYLTFALDFRLHGLDVTGYHIFNLAGHIINALLVYWLVRLAFRSPYFKNIEDPEAMNLSAGFIALFSALLFVAHPIQTQAVTYIVQRFTSLATLFYLFSLIMYIKARLAWSHEGKQYSISSVTFYILSIVSAVLAMKTKEIAFTLPVIIIVYELFFLNGKLGKRILYLFPLMLTLLIIPLSLINIDKPLGDLIGDVSEATRLQTPLSRWDYLFTQFRVITTYIRLLFLPINQNLDYDYPIYHSFLNPEVFPAFLLLSVIFASGIFLFYRSRLENQDSRSNCRSLLRFAAFGIFWFFITLSVESSIIPIEDVIFEHRVYLPSIGAFIATTALSFQLARNLRGNWPLINITIVTALVAATIAFSCVTFARNLVWNDEATFWEDVVGKSPGKARPHNNLGIAFEKEGMPEKAIEEYKTAIQLQPDYFVAYGSLASAYGRLNQFDTAIEVFNTAIHRFPNNPNFYFGLGVAYAKKGLFNEAINNLEQALVLKPNYEKASLGLASIHEQMGLYNRQQ